MAAIESNGPGFDVSDVQKRFAPGITRKRGADDLLGFGIDNVHHSCLVCEWPAQYDEAFVDELIHECGMFGPVQLFFHW